MFRLVTLVLLLATFGLVPALVAALLTSSASFPSALPACICAPGAGVTSPGKKLDRHIVGWIRKIAWDDGAPSGDSTSRATQSPGNVRSS